MEMRRRQRGCLALVICLAASIGLAAQNDRPPKVRFFDVTTAHGVRNERPYLRSKVFAPDDNPIYVWFRAEGCTAGTTIRSAWFYLDADPPLRFREGEITVDRLGDWG